MKTRAFSLTILIAVVLCLWIDKTFGQPFPNTPAIQLGRGFIGHIAYSPDGKILATAGSTLWLYNADDLTEITPLKGHTDFINTVTFSLDGQFLASASNDGTVRLWDTASYHQVAILPHQHPVLSVAVSPDGTLYHLQLEMHLFFLPSVVDLMGITPFGQIKIGASGSQNGISCNP